jgi:membrane-associated protein
MDLSTATSAFASLQGIGYVLLFLMFLIEGPIINYVAAFAASLGFLNVFIILILAILGNIIGDLIFYFVGKLGKRVTIDKYLHRLLKPNKIKKIKEYFKNNLGKTLLVIKITPLIPAPGLILAGMSNVSLKRFLFYSFIISTITCSFITILGFYSGTGFSIIFDYFKYGAYLAGLFVIIILFFWWFVSKRVSNRIEKI